MTEPQPLAPQEAPLAPQEQAEQAEQERMHAMQETPDEPAPPRAELNRDQPVQAAIVPVPDTLQGGRQKTSFWRRLRMRRGKRRDGSLSGPAGDDVVLARLEAIATQLAASEQSVSRRIDRLDEKFSEVWEVEETLSRLTELRDLLTGLGEGQNQLETKLRSLGRRMTFIGVVAGAASVAALAAAFFAFGS